MLKEVAQTLQAQRQELLDRMERDKACLTILEAMIHHLAIADDFPPVKDYSSSNRNRMVDLPIASMLPKKSNGMHRKSLRN